MGSSNRAISFSARARVAEDVLFRELEDESVILSLNSESYYGLDGVGTRFWQVLGAAPSIEAAFQTLSGEFDVNPARLRTDLENLLAALLEHGLIVIHA